MSSTIKVNNIDSASSSSNAMSIANSGVVTFAQTPVGAGGGKLLQAVSATPVASDLANVTQASWRSGGMTVQITPSSTSSKVLLLLMVCPNFESGANTAYSIFKNITSSVAVNTVISGGTNLGQTDKGLANTITSGSTTQPMTLTILDAPSSTSQQTYTYAIRTTSGNNNSPLKGGSLSQFIALEVGG